jgi:nicotinamide-nucleotide amidase
MSGSATAPPGGSAGILAIGDELVLGQTLDRNSAWLAERLVGLGIAVGEHRTVRDDAEAIAAALRALASRHRVVISTGGLGPTADDLTREGLRQAVDPAGSLVEDPAARAAIESWFAGRGRSMPQSNLLQAQRPRGARCLENPRGTAPGLAIEHEGVRYFCLPGPPAEMGPMFEALVAPVLAALAGGTALVTAVVHAAGQGESTLAERLGDLMRRDRDPSVGTTASGGRISARICGRGGAGAAAAVAETVAVVRQRWHPYAFGEGETTLADAVGALLVERGATLAVAESCTAGLLSATVVESAGSSRYHTGGWIVYSNELKARLLGVPQEMLARHGAVSEPVAATLAVNAAQRAETTYALSITGIAGPGGAVEGKPVGTVFIGLCDRSSGEPRVRVRRLQIAGDRAAVRARSVGTALAMLRFRILELDEAPLLWEVPS